MIGANFWYDFNGNGIGPGSAVAETSYILQGHECLVFFLGGIPFQDHVTGNFGMIGFGKDPANPFTNNLVSDPNFGGASNPMYSGNRQPPIFEFNGGRLFLDPTNTSNNGGSPGIPGYYDSLGNSPPNAASSTLNFYVYFFGYGSGVYDANDVNFTYEVDGNGLGPIWLQYQHAGSLYLSPAPNPYATTATANLPNGSVIFEKPQTFQLFSSGVDGLYGVGGQFVPPTASNTTASNALPLDAVDTYSGAPPTTPTTDATIRLARGTILRIFSPGR